VCVCVCVCVCMCVCYMHIYLLKTNIYIIFDNIFISWQYNNSLFLLLIIIERLEIFICICILHLLVKKIYIYIGNVKYNVQVLIKFALSKKLIYLDMKYRV